MKWRKMLSNKKIEEYRKNKKFDFQLNFLIKKSDKRNLDEVAKKKGITTSELLRLLIREYIKQQNIQDED